MKKYIGAIVLSLIASVPLLWVAVLSTQSITKGGNLTADTEITIPTFKECIFTLVNNRLTLMIWVLMIVMIAILIIISYESSYSTKLYKVTNKIKIPVPSGENQHGSSWWMSDGEYKACYPYNVVKTNDATFQWLIKSGYDDLPYNLQKNKLSHYISTTISSSKFVLKHTNPQNQKKKNLEPFEQGGLVVGYKKSLNKEYWYTIKDDIHSLILGFTGSGKTRCFVIQSLINMALAGESIFINDLKGEIYQYTAPFLKKLGYELIVLDFKNMAKSMSYNLLQPVIDNLKNGNVNKAIQRSMDIANILVGEKSEHGEPLWHNGELAVVAASIIACCYDNVKKPKNQNLPYVYEWVTRMCEQRPGKSLLLQEYLKAVGENHPANKLLAQANVAPDKTKGSFYTSAATNLSLWTDRELYHMVNKSDFELVDIGKRKTAFFVILPDDRTTFYKVAALIVSQMYECLSDYADVTLGSGRLPIRVNFLLDEFGNFPAISDIDTKLTMSRSKGIRYNLFLQSFAQLKNRYDDNLAQIIMDNCSQWIYLTASNPETLQTISKKLDKYTTTSYSRSSGKRQDTSTSVNYIERDLLTPGELAILKRPYMLLTSDNGHKVAYSPDLAKWSCNKMLGLGNKKHNNEVRAFRDKNRPILNDITKPPDYEGLWLEKNFLSFCKSYALKRMMTK